MAIRTIPARFPLVQQAELAYGRSMKADILRRFAQAQNFLWANVRRAARRCGPTTERATSFQEVTGDRRRRLRCSGWADALIADMPGGTYKGICVATFAIPALRSATRRSARKAARTSSATPGPRRSASRFTRSTTTDLHRRLPDRDPLLDELDVGLVVRSRVPEQPAGGREGLFGGLLGSSTAGTGGTYDTLTIYSASVRWLPPDELGAPTGTFDFEPVDPTAFTAGDSADVALLDQVRRGLVALGGSRGQTEIPQSWFGEIERTTTSFLEVGRYKVYTSVEVGTVGYRLFLFKGDKDGRFS